ncbi:serine/threonine-protein phosphatase 6 regulatory subunit 3-like isoform X3 [Mya arenaria]|uniref:serine/threonine-protein phosphatase 6 regulatory subunit 3-like isoform X3 n=1 Tax=Mya arenaria TaxID=6604 RepID=UPI0022E7E754|nr:serine/threonine-protein phosphatase 6 regulatory subunit 3-like isoform X3 [Mya arenaria]
MFWKFNLMTTSHIDTLLDKEGVTLHELMDEDDILQECKAQNRKLISFLVVQENMSELVRLITEEPGDDTEEKLRYKYPNTACELLTSDVQMINDALADEDEVHIKKLYAFLDTEKTLNPLLASFFSKVMGLLIARKSEMTLKFLQEREDFVGVMLRHIGTSAIMDLLLRLLTCIESPEVKKAMIDWLNKEKIVQRLVTCITPSYDEDIHSNAAQSLTDIIRLGREQIVQLQDHAELLNTVEQEENVCQLLENMLTGEKNESVIVNGLSVIQTLLEFKKQSSFFSPDDSAEQMTTMDPEQMFTGIHNVLTAICPRLKDFHAILLEPPKQRFSFMPTTVGTLDPPLGNTRLQTSRLIASLLLTNTHSINAELTRLGTISVLLDLYFKYIWNNFLHSHVTQCIYTILCNSPIDVEGSKEHPLLNQLFTEGKIMERILDEWNTNEEEQGKERGRRKGFMGHLTRMANDIVNAQEKGENTETVKALVSELPDAIKERWEAFLTGLLTDTNKKNTVELVQGHNLASSSEDDDADFSNIPFPQDTAMQQAFSDYQLQQMTSNFIDQFGFNEEEFGEHEEKTDSPFTDRISSIDFSNVSEDLNRPSATRFEQYCNERLQQFDNDSDEDIWEEKEITFSPNTQQQSRSERLPVTRGSSNDSDNSTDSEEELDSPKRITEQTNPAEKMDVDSHEGWANFEQQTSPSGASGGETGQVAMDTSPWDSNSGETKPASTDNWADFGAANSSESNKTNWTELTGKVPEEKSKETWADFTNFDSIEKRVESEPRSSSPVAMDTTEPSSRTNAYLASENKVESDLKLESVDTSIDNDIGTDVDKLVEKSSPEIDSSVKTEQSSVSGSALESAEPDSTTGERVESGESVSQSGVESTTSDTDSSQQATVSESPPELPDSPPPDNTSASLPSPSPGVTTPASPRVSPATTSPQLSPRDVQTPPTSCQSTNSVDTPTSPRDTPPKSGDTPPDAQAQGDRCKAEGLPDDDDDDDDVDDLSSNFNFLSKTGLMKPGSNCTPLAGDIQGNGPTKELPDSTTDKLEEIRSQAKEALESYDSATTVPSTGANVQNGPV